MRWEEHGEQRNVEKVLAEKPSTRDLGGKHIYIMKVLKWILEKQTVYDVDSAGSR
jgi:hypothetical protein